MRLRAAGAAVGVRGGRSARQMAAIYAMWKPVHLTVEQRSPPTSTGSGRRLVLNDFIARLAPSRVECGRISAVGRLDKETDGLLLLTDDGVLAERLLRPGAVPKVYEATVRLRAPTRPSNEQFARLCAGVDLAGQAFTLPSGSQMCASARYLSPPPLPQMVLPSCRQSK